MTVDVSSQKNWKKVEKHKWKRQTDYGTTEYIEVKDNRILVYEGESETVSQEKEVGAEGAAEEWIEMYMTDHPGVYNK